MAKKKKEKKEKKDKNAPKRAISAFFFYQKERREPLKKEKPNLSNKELISTMSNEWNNMSENDKIKKEDKKRYEKEKSDYDAKQKGGKKSAKKEE